MDFQLGSPGGEIGDKFGDWETGFAAAFRS
jgi:hypothetical protein